GGAPHLEVVHAHHTLGGGVEGRVSGRTLAVGSRAFVLQRHIELPNWAEGLEITYATRGLTPIFVAVDGAVAAVAAIGDPIRPDAHDAVDRLHRLGWTVGVLSGDHPQVAAVVASDLGVDAAHTWGGAAPETKLDLVRDLSVRGETIVMVGDGVNDAPALAAASVGVSVHAGAEASLAAADVSLSREGLAPLVELVEGAQRTVKAIHRNLRVSLCYNLICATLAVTGIITPLIAAVLMPVSSLTVIALSIRARTFGVR
ncbi:MAG: HAD-IC family P-type ATPase, partial [Planctomycetota bacterium]|nr:HAD-IC family P-type ATPase [Planctomycetota bacterium]